MGKRKQPTQTVRDATEKETGRTGEEGKATKPRVVVPDSASDAMAKEAKDNR